MNDSYPYENHTSGTGWTCQSCWAFVPHGQTHACGRPLMQANQTLQDWGQAMQLARLATAMESIADSLDVLAHPLLKVHGDTQVCRCSENGCSCGEPEGSPGDRGEPASPEGEDRLVGLTD